MANSNRIIKFRAWIWRGSMYEMIKFDLESVPKWISTKDDVVMQFTGLKDKNGKEIYEGDILSVVVIGKFVEWIVQVTWSDLDNGWMVIHDESSNGRLHKLNFDLIEVIGNIYKNVDLLR